MHAPTAGIIIPTMNRAAFVIRQLKYYARVKCSHTIYIDDASEGTEAATLASAAKKMSGDIAVVYANNPKSPYIDSKIRLLEMVREDYATYSADDDLQVPHSVSEAASFLATHPDYAVARGNAVTVRLDRSGPYGRIVKISDYPQPEIHDQEPTNRIIRFFKNYFVANFAVHRTKQWLEHWRSVRHIPNRAFKEEIVPCALDAASGKAKTLDSLGFVRQIHDSHYEVPSMFDWLTRDDWLVSYKECGRLLAETMRALSPHLTREEAERAIKQGLWFYTKTHLDREYYEYYPEDIRSQTPHAFSKLKFALGKALPVTKTLYYRLRGRSPKLHYLVKTPGNPYYDEFMHVRAIVEEQV